MTRIFRWTVACLWLAASAAAQTGEWRNSGPTGAAVEDLVFDPRANTTIYAATRTGGVYKSTDGGASWREINNGLGQKSINVLAIDPSDPDTVYAGSNSGSGGLFLSTDAGVQWRPASSGLGNRNVSTIAVDPHTTSTLYVGTFRGAYRSTDGGTTWSVMSNGLPEDRSIRTLAIDHDRPATIYAGGFFEGIFKSEDSGDTWTLSNEGLAGLDARFIVVDPHQPEVIYALVADRLARSTDGGAQWSLSSPLGFHDVKVDPETPGLLYALTSNGLSRSLDQGVSWETFGLPTPYSPRNLAVAADGLIHVGTLCGAFSSHDPTQAWHGNNRGLRAAQARALVADPVQPRILYASTAHCGTFKSVNGAATWRRLPDLEFSISSLAVDSNRRLTVYANQNGRIFVSNNGGNGWRRLDTTSSGLLVIGSPTVTAVDPADSSTVYAAITDHLIKTEDHGESWSLVDTGANLFNIHDIVFGARSAVHRSTVYLATTSSGVLESTDGGASWVERNRGLPETRISSLIVDAEDPLTLYAGVSRGGVYKTIDGARTWQPANQGIERGFVLALSVAPDDPETLYAGTLDRGVFRSRDGAESWQPLGGPLDLDSVEALVSSAGTLTAATHDGIYTFNEGGGDRLE